MFVKPDRFFEIGHPAYHTSRASTHFGICVSAFESRVTYVDEEHNIHLLPDHWSGRIYATAIVEGRNQLAIAHGNQMSIVDLAGNEVFSCDVPFQNNRDSDHRCYFCDLLHDPFRDELWAATSLSNETFELLVYDAKQWNLRDRRVVKDPFYNSDQTFCATHHSGLVGMYLTTGGCGEEFYILDRRDGAIAIEDSQIGDSRYAEFSPDHKRFVTVEGYTTILCWGYPNVGNYGSSNDVREKLAERSSRPDDSSIGSSLAFLDDTRLLISNNEDVTSILNLESWQIEDRVEFRLSNDQQLLFGETPNWTYFWRTGDAIAFWQSDGQSNGFFFVPLTQFQ